MFGAISILALALAVQEPPASQQGMVWTPSPMARQLSPNDVIPVGADEITASVECDLQADGTTTGCRVASASLRLSEANEAALLGAAEGGKAAFPAGQARPATVVITLNLKRDPMDWVVEPSGSRADLAPEMIPGVQYQFTLRCVAEFDGSMRQCEVLEQRPAGQGAAESAVRVAQRGRVSARDQTLSEGMRTFTFTLGLMRTE